MPDLVLAGCRWLESTPCGVMVRESAWMYPVMKWIHFTGLSVWFAANVTLDRRLTWIGFFIAFAGGFFLFSVEATTYVSNPGFVLKLAVLTPLALWWTVIVQNRAGAVILWIAVVTASVVFLLTNAGTYP
jgi:hypothetical protein